MQHDTETLGLAPEPDDRFPMPFDGPIPSWLGPEDEEEDDLDDEDDEDEEEDDEEEGRVIFD